ncbi:hypothetical protein [Streptomyces sp. NPDC059788]|uniref:hypothetical protein n=1 Tax=Streptomyces sp. NPDC059788 TaxID=3346948 RepID=UPI0036499556
MPAVVVVHGVGKQYLGPQTLHGSITPAVLDGVRLADGPALTAQDVEVAFYGHWFRPAGSPSPAHKGDAAPSDSAHPYDTELLLALWTEAARTDPDRVPPPPDGGSRTKAATPQFVQRALYALSRSRFLARTADRFLIGVLQQVRRYLTEERTREQVQREIASVVTPETRVLIGHSLGSVVAYEALCRHPEWQVTAFVSVGSPLGIPHLVFDRLVPGPVAGAGAWPGRARTWTNICDRRDVVALTKRLAPLFPGGPAAVHDVLVDNGWQAHAIERHLTAVETGAAIAAGLTG